MKKLLPLLLTLAVVGASTGFTSCSKEKQNVVPGNTTTTPTTATLTAFEQQSLTFTREEEKMAHDVYTALLAKWPNLSFMSNIISSEQKHMDAVKSLLDKYGITDPIGNNGAGVFTNADIQKLYNDLVAQGSKSEMEALYVGLTIEDMDIYDIQNALKQIDKADIITVFGNLSNGSSNHMREFHDQYTSRGGTYTPQYITQDEYNTIVTTPKQHGGGN